MNADKAPAALPVARIKPKLTVMGRIVTAEDAGRQFITHPMALLIEFDSVGEIREAIKRGTCEFELGTPDRSEIEHNSAAAARDAAPELLTSLKAMLSIYPLDANAITLAAQAVVDKIEACAAGE